MKMNKLLSVLISAALTASTFTFPAMAEENTEKSYDEIFTPASVENTEDMTVEMFDVEQWLTEGDGTEENPYMISSAEVLSQLADEVNGGNDCSGIHFKLSSDIDLSSVCGADLDGEEVSWIPIGKRTGTSPDVISADDKPFSGIFDGNGYKVSGLYINGTNDFCGLFGYIKDGAVKNLTVSGSITGKDCVGGIAGWNSAVIENCVNNCVINGSKGNTPLSFAAVGGIAGTNFGTILCCYNNETISSVDNYLTSDYIGGICGENYGTVENCYNKDIIEGRFMVGGIAGNNTNTIRNCYNYGYINAEYNAGGISGGNESIIENCFYDEEKSEKGVAVETGAQKTETYKKSYSEFKNGSVAYLLQKAQKPDDNGSIPQVWGQKIIGDYFVTDRSPVLSGDSEKTVYKVTFATQSNAEYAVEYANADGVYQMPMTPSGSENSTFLHWSVTASADGETFTDTTPVTGNMTVYAVKRDSVQATDANDVFSYKWGDTITPINLNDYIENKTEAENDFVFSLNPDSPFPKGLTLSEDGIVSGTLESFGNYTIVFDVVSKSGISLMSVDDNKSQLTLYMGIEYTNGKGTEDEPYLISSLETLMLMRDAVNIGTDYSGKYFKQTTDIDLSSQYGPNFDTNGRSWPRIGTIANPFYGTYDGDGHRIDNLYINGKASYRGFFGYIGDGTVKNLTVSGRVTSNDRVGGIVGYLEKGTVENCVNEVNVTGGTHKASVISVRCGGIVGLAGEATIKNCVNKGTVKNVTEYGGDETGGIVGSGGDCSNAIVIDCINLGSVNGVCCAGGIIGANWGTRIESCINQGNISLEHNTKYYVHAGGITGINYGPISNCINIGDVDNVNDGTAFIGGVVGSNCSEIINCYNAGDVKGADNVGGIAGENNNKIENCYNIGYVKGYVPESKVGGIVGKNDNTDTDNVITGCYYLFGTADAGIFEEQDQEGVTKALTVADFAQQSNFSGWDFENIWEMNTVFGRPCLKNCLEEQFYGDGTEDNPYLITNARMLEALRNSVNNGENYSGKYFKLTEDIDLSLVCGADVDGTERSWTPIGMRNNTTFDESADDKPFSGIFDGNGHKISSLYINGTNDFCGLFGYIKDGAVKNLTVSGSIVGKDCVGGIAGWNSGVIETCVSKCSVTGSKGNQPMSYASVGGIAGLNEGTISRCYNINTISSVDNSLTSDSVGGICGDNYGIIENCFNTGEVSGRFLIGGIAGNNTKTIKNCYSIGIITAEAHAGGITADNGSVVENSYYLEGTSEKGVIYTNNAEKTEIESKTAAEFAGGSVAYLLQSAQTEGSMIWGQTLDAEGADSYPVLSNDNAKSVYKVTFVSNNAEYSASYANPNRTVTLPEAPKVSGYTFVKWAKTNSSDAEEFTAETPVTENMTVYAVTKRTSSGGGSGSTSYTVTFETNGGSKISSVKVTRNDAVSAPTSPTKDGYTFDGWYSDKALTEAYDFTAKVTKSFTIYAKWTENEKEQDKPTNPDNPVNPQWENPFNDVKENDWFYSNVEYAVKNGLMNGVSDNEFAPNAALTRAMFVTVLYRMENEPETANASFTDVVSGSWYEKAVAWAYAGGLVTGVSETEFAPEDTITREQMAAILYRYAKFKGMDVSVRGETSYTDKDAISDYAADAVIWAATKAVMSGNADGSFAPADNATRAEAAAVFMRIQEILK